MANNLYWTDEGLLTINVVRLDKTNVSMIIAEGNLSHPRAIVVDPSMGQVMIRIFMPVMVHHRAYYLQICFLD